MDRRKSCCRILPFWLAFLLFPAHTTAVDIADLNPIKTTLSSADQQLIKWIDAQQAAMLKDLETLVNINTGTLNREGLDRVSAILKEDLTALGFDTRMLSGGEVSSLTCDGGKVRFANHLVALRNPHGKSPRLLLNGHLDTVFPAGSEFDQLIIEGDQLKGPGVSDMKGGIIVMLYALRALDQAGLLANNKLTVLLNTDEEMGSLGSRGLIEEQAVQHDLGLVFESTRDNQLTRHRKGLGQARLRVTGRAAHAGSSHQLGLSAIRELAHKVIAIEQLTDYAEQTTLNVGMISGGEARNTVPPCADAYVDMRFPGEAQGTRVIAELERISATTHTHNSLLEQSPQTELWATLHRPAKPIHPGSDAIMARAMGISAALGQPLGTRYSGGGTDGSIMQAAGLPNADSLGPDGAGDHSSREETTISSLMQRTRMAAVLLSRLMEG